MIALEVNCNRHIDLESKNAKEDITKVINVVYVFLNLRSIK